MRPFRRCQHTFLSYFACRSSISESEGSILSLSCTSHLCCQSLTARHRITPYVRAMRIVSQVLAQFSSVRVTSAASHSHADKESHSFLIRCAVTVARGLGLYWAAPYPFPLLTSKVLVCEPLFMSVWEGDEA